ncbi:MAG: chain-length determining protein, partial [Bacteroidaceae bacterium]|nr:chain-length determining protein [Bacteroidaceae bacterium]
MEEKASHKVSIDIVKLFRIVIGDIRKMILYCFVGGVISIIVAFSIPRIYKSRVLLAPEDSSSSFSGNLSSLA